MAHGETGTHAIIGANITHHSSREVTASALGRVEPLAAILHVRVMRPKAFRHYSETFRC